MRLPRECCQDEVGPLADLVFVGCNLAEAAAPLTPAGGVAPRRLVLLDGRRLKTVDVHAHCVVPEAMALMGRAVSPPPCI
jgi:aminocarboxymuconate-semialdehyde decarboxylase